MKIEKISKSSYRIRKMYKGKTYTVITDYKPTQKEAVLLMAEELEKHQVSKSERTFENVAREYIESKSNVLSPSTIREYTGTIDRMDERFKQRRISDIDQNAVQKYINQYAATHAPKTVRNMNGFITSVIGSYAPNISIKTKLPQKQIKSEYVPSDDDVKRVLAEASGSEFEIPFLLAVYGLRRSEICALSANDLSGDNVLTINKAKVLDKDKRWIVKPYTKNVTSSRHITLDDSVADKIRQKGYIYKGHPTQLLTALNRYQDRLGIPRFTLHKLRHYFASMAHAKGIPDKYIMQMGGWKTDGIMKSVYRHAFDEKQKESNQIVNDHMKKILS